ncbi:MAG: rod shape-determining protein MreC [Vicinamibacterales bacterium]
MAILDLRRRNGTLFGVLTLVHVLVISAQVTTRSGLPLPAQLAFGVFADLQQVVAAVSRGLNGAWAHYVDLRRVRTENQRLTDELGALRVRLQQQEALASRAAGLQALLALRDATAFSTSAASIIGGSSSPEFRTVTIDRGGDHQVEADMPVIAPAGVVGRVIRTTARAAKVQLLIDRNAAAGVLIERSRAQGVAMGLGGPLLRMDFVAGSADVAAGDRVLTSGIDGIYPKGLLVGQVQSVGHEGGTLGDITIRPAVDFGRLEDVLIITGGVVPAGEEDLP